MMSAQAKRWFIWLLLGGLLIAAMTMLFWPRAAAVDLAIMSSGSLVVTIDEEGKRACATRLYCRHRLPGT